MLESIGGRKMAISAVTVLICCVTVFIKGDVPAGLADMLKFILGSFIVGNVGADVVAAVTAKKAEASSEEPAPVAAPLAAAIQADVPMASPQLDRIEATVSAVLEATNVNQQGLAFIVERIAPQKGLTPGQGANKL